MNTFANSMLLLGLGLTLVLAGISIFVCRRQEAGLAGYGPQPLTKFFLVALRLSIGWHFLVEGMDKLNNPSWSSEPYLREAVGPLAPAFRDIAGDRLKDKLILGEGGSFPAELDIEWQAYLDEFTRFYELDGEQAQKAAAVLGKAKAATTAWLKDAKKPVQKTSEYPPPLVVPMSIAERLKEYQILEAKVREIEDEVLPKYGADAFPKLKTAKANLNRWRAELKADLDQKTAEFKRALRDQLLAAIAIGGLPREYQVKALEARMRELEDLLSPKYAKDDAKSKIFKAELNQWRAELKKDLDQKASQALREQILAGIPRSALPGEYQDRLPETKEPLASLLTIYHQILLRQSHGEDVKLPPQAAKAFEYAIDRKRDKQDPNELLPVQTTAAIPAGLRRATRPLGAWSVLDWSDFFVTWGVTLTGVCLLAGLLTRTACLVGAYLLLTFFLAMPPLPGWPESPRAEGHYLWINKNVIEMLALLTLATTRSGRWVGLDGLLQFLRPARWQNAPPSSTLEKVVKLEDEPTVAINEPDRRSEVRNQRSEVGSQNLTSDL